MASFQDFSYHFSLQECFSLLVSDNSVALFSVFCGWLQGFFSTPLEGLFQGGIGQSCQQQPKGLTTCRDPRVAPCCLLYLLSTAGATKLSLRIKPFLKRKKENKRKRPNHFARLLLHVCRPLKLDYQKLCGHVGASNP